VVQTYFRNENQTTVYIIPGGQSDVPPENYSEVRSLGTSMATTAHKPTSFENHSVFATPDNWQHPLSFGRKPSKITYPQARQETIGQTPVFYLPDRQLPLIDLNILVKVGEVDVEPNRYGLADLLGDTLIRGGTTRYGPSELARILDENAIKMSVRVREEFATIGLSVLRSEWQKGLELLTEVLTHPRFDQGVLKVAQNRAITALKRQGEDAQAVAAREATVWHFGQHPYGRDPMLGLDTIAQIKPADLERFLKAYFVPSNMVIAIAGDIGQKDAIDGLRNLLAALPQGKAPRRTIADPKQTPPVLALIHKPGQVQSQVILHLPGPKRTQPDFWKLRLLMDIFGGNDSLMYTRLRDDLGLVYTAGFYQSFKWQAGMLVGYIGCKGDKTRLAIADTVRIMESLQHDVPEQTFDLKRLDALNSFVFNVDTPADLVNVYGTYHLRGEPLDTLERIQEAYLTADRQVLRGLARKYLKAERIQIFVVADKNTPVRADDGGQISLETDLKQLAKQLQVDFRKIDLR
jgi:zinc protease